MEADEVKDEPSSNKNIEPPAALDKDKDNLSIKSTDSITTSGEYEIVPETPNQLGTLQVAATKIIPLSPVLAIAGDMTEMEKNLTDVIRELDVTEGKSLLRCKIFKIISIKKNNKSNLISATDSIFSK